MIGAVLLMAMAATEAGNLCTLCHPDVRVQFERSIHRSEEVNCVMCHGGNPAASNVPGAHAAGFRGRIHRREIPALCASCHADSIRMRPYGLPTDQYALYQTSRHGERLAAGDEKVAVCTDCHGVHEILRRDDPAGSVFPPNIPAMCGRCHSDASLMRPYGRTTDPRADYLAGVHGEALSKRSDSSAPDCTRCHGAHGAAPPGVGNVEKACGHCHTTARAHFLAGPHRAAMRKASLPECESCHGNHRIERAGVDLLDKVCLNCHAQGSAQVELALQMKTLYTSASDELDRAGTQVQKAAEIPLYVDDYRARLQEGRTSLIESLPVMHELNLSRVEDLTRRARSIGNEVESEVNGKLEGRLWRRVGLLIFWFYLLLTVAILVRMRRAAARETGS